MLLCGVDAKVGSGTTQINKLITNQDKFNYILNSDQFNANEKLE